MVLEQQTSSNGEAAPSPSPPVLPELIVLTRVEASRVPSAGAQRALKAETGKEFDEIFAPGGDGADRTQTLVWMKLRQTFPALRWADCSEVAVQVEEGALAVDPTQLAVSAISPGSAASGG